MRAVEASGYDIRKARPEEFQALGRLAVAVYAGLPGMPGIDEQPEYYGKLADVASRAGNPAISVFTAVSRTGDLLGCVDFIEEMQHYGSGGTAGTIADAAGIRLLAVKPECRGKGVGKAMTRFCIDRASQLGRKAVILHTTRIMQTAWAMYAALGFVRLPEIDFVQGNLQIFGFRLDLSA